MAWRDRFAEKALSNRVEIGEGVKIPKQGSLLLQQLLSRGHLLDDEVEEIEAETPNSGRVSHLLDCLHTRLTRQVFIDFVDALEHRCKYPELADSLRQAYRDLGGTLEMVSQQETQEQAFEAPLVFAAGGPETALPRCPPIRPPGCDVVAPSADSAEMTFCCRCRDNFFLFSPRHRKIAFYDVHGSPTHQCPWISCDKSLQLPDAVADCHEFLTLGGHPSKWVCRRGDRLITLKLGTTGDSNKTFRCELMDDFELDDDGGEGHVTCMLVHEKRPNHVFVGTSHGSVVAFEADDEARLQLLCEVNDSDEEVVGMCAGGGGRIALWRAGGVVEVGNCVLGFEQEHETSVAGEVVTCAFVSDAKVAAVVRLEDGAAQVAVWTVGQGRPRTVSIGRLGAADKAELATEDEHIVVATPSRLLRLSLRDGSSEEVREWRAEWFKPLNGREWVARVDGEVRKVSTAV